MPTLEDAFFDFTRHMKKNVPVEYGGDRISSAKDYRKFWNEAELPEGVNREVKVGPATRVANMEQLQEILGRDESTKILAMGLGLWLEESRKKTETVTVFVNKLKDQEKFLEEFTKALQNPSDLKTMGELMSKLDRKQLLELSQIADGNNPYKVNLDLHPEIATKLKVLEDALVGNVAYTEGYESETIPLVDALYKSFSRFRGLQVRGARRKGIRERAERVKHQRRSRDESATGLKISSLNRTILDQFKKVKELADNDLEDGNIEQKEYNQRISQLKKDFEEFAFELSKEGVSLSSVLNQIQW